MAQLTFPVTHAGLALPVWIGLTGAATASLLQAGQRIPPPILTRGLVDTGSNVTVVASWVLQQLAIPLAASRSTHTAAGQVNVDLYQVSLSITDPNQRGAPVLADPHLLVMELAVILPDTDVLVGRDVLLQHRLFLDGPARQFTLDF